MKRKFLTLFLALAASVGTIFAQSGTTGTIQWTLSNGVLTISPYESPEGDIPDYNAGSFSPWYSYNDQIKKIVVADNILKIGKRAFQGTYAESVVLGKSVTTIMDLAFSYNTKLKAVTIPANVSTIGKDAFGYCNELDSVACLRTLNVPTCGETPFSLTKDNLIIYVPYSLITKYRSAENWSVYGDKIKPFNSRNTEVRKTGLYMVIKLNLLIREHVAQILSGRLVPVYLISAVQEKWMTIA